MKRFVNAADAVHLIVVGTVDGTALAASLLAHLTEEGCRFLMVRAQGIISGNCGWKTERVL